MNRWEIAPELGASDRLRYCTLWPVYAARSVAGESWIYAYINKKKLKILLATVY